MATSDGQPLFGRAYSVTIDTLEVSNLRCVFKVKKTLKPQPNTCEIQIYNLAADSRHVLETPKDKKLSVRLEAGYEATGTAQLYLGQVRAASTEWEGPDAITTVTTGDSEKEIAESRIHVSVGAHVPVETALRAIVRALKVGEGNVDKAVALLKSKGAATMFGPGTAISGNAARELTDFCRSAGLEWSIQDGKIQILDLNKPLSELAVQLSAETGLIGSPTIDFNAASKGKAGGLFVKARALLIPELSPGRKVVFKSKSVVGGYRIDEIEYTGDTHGTEWYADLVCRTY